MAARLWRLRPSLRLFPVQNGVTRQVCLSAVQLKGETKVTHTGQQWAEDDYRNVRFIDREKQVNEQFAIDLVAEEPVEVITGSTRIWCDGGDGALGHPKVYINLDKPEINVCGYCGKRFVAAQHRALFPDEQFKDS